jgi:uncharacterized membrane protein YuzA (DUF378 family)
MAYLHQDPEIGMASFIGFVTVGKLVEWFAGNTNTFASISYVLASLAALVTIYYKIKNKGK